MAWFARQQFNGKQDSEKVLRGRVTGSAAAYELNLRCPRNGKQTSGLEFFSSPLRFHLTTTGPSNGLGR